MIVIHAVWNNSENKLYLWGEDSTKFSNEIKGKSHPFACSKRDLTRIIKEIFPYGKGRYTEIILNMPSTDIRPIPSPQLIIDDYSYYSKPTGIKEWKIPSLEIDQKNITEFLLTLNPNPPENIIYGETLVFWRMTARFAIELIAKGSYLPVMSMVKNDHGSSYLAKWQVNLTRADAEKATLLAKMLFPMCTYNNSNAYEDLINFLNLFIDTYLRSSSIFDYKNRKIANIADSWFSSLFSDPELHDNLRTAESFYTQVNYWIKQAQNTNLNSPFRTCFKVEASSKNLWNIQFLLQANEDPSLLVPADKVWNSPKEIKFLNRKFEDLQERLLEDLGRASRYFPELDESLKNPAPSFLYLNTEHFYKFLRDVSPVLDDMGFGILLPSWLQKPERIGIKLKLKSSKTSKTSSGLFGLDSIVEFDWAVAIGDQIISEKEFRDLAKLKIPLVKIRGKWVEIKPEDVEKAIQFFEKMRKNKISLGEALKLNLTGDSENSGLPVIELEGDSNLSNILAKLKDNRKISSVGVPESFKGTLREYQIKGLSWLQYMTDYGFGACLADDMGLGKTVQSIALILLDQKQKKPSLIVCPMSIVENWVKEIHKFAPGLRVLVHHGVERLGGKNFLNKIKENDVVITTYSILQRDIADMSKPEWNYIILDEAQNIKNPETKQARAVKQLYGSKKIALTGTPIENRLTELWSIMEFLNPGYLGSFKSFRENFAIPVEKNHDTNKAKILKQMVQPFILRRLKTDKNIIKDLPEKMEMKVFCNLTSEQGTLYEAVVNEMIEKIEASNGIERRGLVLATIIKLKQICNHPAQFLKDNSRLETRSGKMERLKEMIEEAISEGDKVLVFTQFAEMGSLLKKYLQEQFHSEILFLHGGTPKKQRDIIIERFQSANPYSPKIFVLSIKAGGLGLNLTAANRVFHFDRWWNPAVENQATDRTFRIGQSKNVYVYKFIVTGTIEERVDRLIESKKELVENVVGSGEEWLTELSTEELRKLFKLDRSVVGD
ncbi:MAG: DEAD/DEAH box helicase [Thermoplasmata archaeon]